MRDFGVKGGIFEEKTRDFYLKSGIFGRKMRGFWVKSAIFGEKVRDPRGEKCYFWVGST